MKAIKLLPLIIFMMAAVSSCTVEEYYTNDDRYEETWDVFEFEVLENEWELVGAPNREHSYYISEYINLPLNTAFDDGIISAYIYRGDYYEFQTPLPYIQYFNNEWGEYSFQYSYDVTKDGVIAFKAYVSDYGTSSFNPGYQRFRVAIVY